MIDSSQLFQIKLLLESQTEGDLLRAQEEIQRVVYSLGGSRDISQMSPGATALYLTILLELSRS